ncbi:UDP-N-acetylmuramoyl-L-alanyl-D-glutamate--2,6-diaminopimelate ligase [Collinsella sp. AGMB00827]|uniref:UDP-N-acetylmuramoyl-L-alanyl-D-glutamate--2, 6-diaminopimelate ligase n=1 Tax=Collinsella ureilytica TaxID=2869515 RepID=A0ABS7MJ89_9ACTN|nr:UDP-N-acetylmuramoyl-L-alanyl-D-glutamate--2,6-diaminopimelate ligase [Collinsella urealyticum]MBY4797439.1 UDP-N-acetylmuramoyl-L-alanyl-D-glutamate--2,6-diaminopimelate ligase [Collinsella urealyticum]
METTDRTPLTLADYARLLDQEGILISAPDHLMHEPSSAREVCSHARVTPSHGKVTPVSAISGTNAIHTTHEAHDEQAPQATKAEATLPGVQSASVEMQAKQVKQSTSATLLASTETSEHVPQAFSATPTNIASRYPTDWKTIPVKHASDDSRSVEAHTLFVCKGAAFKRDYLLSAIASGAVGYVSAHDYDVDIPLLLVSDIRRALAVVADAAYGHPSAALKICALTGTKGKTTCAYYLNHLLCERARALNKPQPGLFSTVEYFDGIESGGSQLTTPEPFQLHERFSHARDAGLEQIIMEASSQALKYDRTYGITFAVGAFLNIGRDHISPIEHPNFEDYLTSKLRIFNQSETAVVNLDMDFADRVLAAAQTCEHLITYSLTNPKADIYVEHLSHTSAGMTGLVHTPGFTREMHFATPVAFNVSNALATIACALALGTEEQFIVHAFEDMQVPGRMKLIPSPDGSILGVVDYAHNGMSLSALLKGLKESYPDREIIAVFGATGGKGADRRRTMGEAAGQLADNVIVTEDDPGPEDSREICNTIAECVAAEGRIQAEIILDREQAIRAAVDQAKRPAVVVIAGKGDDAYMLRNGVREPYTPDSVTLKAALDEACAAAK